MTPPDLVIFDCDGVLIDSEVIGSRVYAEELTRIGCPITREEIVLRFIGLTPIALRAYVEQDWGRSLPSDLEETLQALMKEIYRTDLSPIEGIGAVLDRLDLPSCVASSSLPDKMLPGIELTGLWERFAPHIFSASMVSAGKPAPDLFSVRGGAHGCRASAVPGHRR